jgi:exonuclease III
MNTNQNSSQNRRWRLLSWNVRGINSRLKWNAIREKIVDSGCDIFCFQETKRDNFDAAFLRKLCPSEFDKFEFLPSVGASGGVLTAWKGRLFTGDLIFSNRFGISVNFTSMLNADSCVISNFYGPCTGEGKEEFTNWLKEIEMPKEIEWLVVGDFNLMRKPEDRNREGGDINEMFMFNEAISALGWNEVILQGRRFTWSNMQPSPLLEKIDWIFASNSWILKYPDTTAKGLGRTPSDHCPCLVTISTSIPRPKAFRFENYWLKLQYFPQILAQV